MKIPIFKRAISNYFKLIVTCIFRFTREKKLALGHSKIPKLGSLPKFIPCWEPEKIVFSLAKEKIILTKYYFHMNVNFIEVAIARLVEQRVSTLCEAGSNPVIALKFFTEVLCIISVMEEIPASLTDPRLPSSAHQWY